MADDINQNEQPRSAALTFCFAMMAYPDVQRRAQQQLDHVVGPDRLPRNDDRESLPYIDALVREVLRWQPITPLAALHQANADGEYRGYFIPKGTTVIPNAWQV